MDNIKSAVAVLTCGEEQGTAFLVSNTLALTMTHCIEDAIENQKEIILSFKNICDQEEITIEASVVSVEEAYPVSILKLNEEIQIEPLDINCCVDHISREEKLMAYGYPHVKIDEGCPIDIFINDYLNENVVNDGDVTLVIDPKIRIENFAGMSGSPVLYRNKVIGILIEQGIESIGNNRRAVDVKMISIKRIQKLLDIVNISYSSITYKEMQEQLRKLKQPKEYCETENYYNERKKNYKEKYVTGYCELNDVIEDYEQSIDTKLQSIFLIKNRGNIEKAWEELRELTMMVRGSRSKPSKTLSRLYYLQACWYLDDYEDCSNAQKYIRKTLEVNPNYDCRNYNAKKMFVEGNVIGVKKILDPIDNVSVLNTYIQLCVRNIEIEDAYKTFKNNKQMANSGTYYLMSLICILDGEYALAHQYLKKAREEDKDIPLHIMMEGVILYWELLPSNMVHGDSLLPSMYTNSMLLLSNELKQKINEITCLYKKAYELAEIAGNIGLQKQILIVWLNTLSISNEYRKDSYEIASKLMVLEPYQCQAVLYFYITGKEIPLREDFDPSEFVQKKGNNIESMISCVYLFMNSKNNAVAYKKLKEYRFKFEEMHMMDLWFELAVQCCKDQNQLILIKDSLDEANIDFTIKERIKGMLLEVLGEREELLKQTLLLYQKTQLEIDLINLINCYERNQNWKEAELFCNEWLSKFHNPMANVKIVRYLALQNKQDECLNKICEFRKSGHEEYLTNEVLFYEIQALKLLGKYNEAIEKGEALWDKEVSPKILLLLAECYYLNVQEQEAVHILKDGIKKGIKDVEVYQMYAEYSKRINTREAVKYVKETLIQSKNDPPIMMWAMNFLYSIGESDSASELFVKLRTLDKVNNFRSLTFKEVKEWIDEVEKENEKRLELYMKCKFPYHVFFDCSGTASYTLYCHQLWNSNGNYRVRKQLLLTSFGGRDVSNDELEKSLGQNLIVDFSSLIHMKHFEILDDINECWNQMIISGNISNIITIEQNKCLPNQPDRLEKKKKMMDAWKKRSLNYIEGPSQHDLNKWLKTGINLVDIIPYEMAKRNNLILISNNFISDLLEETYKITDEMRKNVISTYELLVILERRGEVKKEFVDRYRGERKLRQEAELKDVLVEYNGRLPVLVDEIFLQEIFEMDGVAILSYKCNIYVINNIFYSIENEMKNIKLAKEAYEVLADLKNDIQKYKDVGNISYYGFYKDESKSKNSVFTNDIIDLFYYAFSHKCMIVCDDRWVNSYDNFDGCNIYSIADIVEILHRQRIISNERYIGIITQMFSEGYAYILPPFEYMKLLLEQIPDGKSVWYEIPEELSTMCDYLICITGLKSRLGDEIVRQEAISESVSYMHSLQKILKKLIKYVWCTERSELWKREVSDWLLANFSIFSYRSIINDSVENNNQNDYELEVLAFLISGICELSGSSYRKEYYNWLFGWFGKSNQWKNNLESRLIQSLVNFICEVCKEKDVVYKDIGIGMWTISITSDMPEYYRNLIKTNTSVAPIIENIEDSFAFLGEKNFVLRKHFNQWIEDAMEQGLNNSIIKMNERVGKEYTITFIVNELFHQGFKIEYLDDNGKKRIHYFRIDQAMLLSKDMMLRIEGLSKLNEFISDADMKKYRDKLNSENWEEIVNKIVLEVKSKENYIMHIIAYMLENKITLFSVTDLFPDNTKLFENILNNAENEVFDRVNKWIQNSDKDIVNISSLLIIYIYNSLVKNEIYSSFSEEEIDFVTNYFVDIILTKIMQLNENKKLKYTLQKLSDRLLQLNNNMGFLEDYRDLTVSQKEAIRNEISEYFKLKNLQQEDGNKIADICKKIYFVQEEDLKIYLPKIKEWIMQYCEKNKEDVSKEIGFLNVMENYAIVKNREKTDQTINCYLELWEEILDREIHVNLSRNTIYMLRRNITSFSFEQGIRMRKIIERIVLQDNV